MSFVTQYITLGLNLNTLQNVAELWNDENPEQAVTVVASHTSAAGGNFGFAYVPDERVKEEIEKRVRGRAALLAYVDQAGWLASNWQVVRAEWNLLKATDILVWQDAAFKNTSEWREWQGLVQIARTNVEIALELAPAEEKAQYEKVRQAWLHWHLPASPEKAVAL